MSCNVNLHLSFLKEIKDMYLEHIDPQTRVYPGTLFDKADWQRKEGLDT